MITIKFRNEKGEFTNSQNCNHGFEIDHEICTVKVYRNGQQSAVDGNKIRVSVDVTSKGTNIRFNNRIFGRDLSTMFNNNLFSINKKNTETVTSFYSEKWAKAFEQAKDYVFAELAKYDELKKERDRALIDAEF